MRARVAAPLAAFALVLLGSSAASAFCRTMTCDPNDPKADCEFDAAGCVVSGLPLSWASSCVTVGVKSMGSPRNDLNYEVVAQVVEQAFGAWQGARCGSKAPSIDVQLIGAVECGLSEYNSKVGNANIVLFREDEWPYAGASNAIGLTTTRFDTKTGELWDADIELNGVGANLSVGDPIAADDLQSVLTHEAGHFLGLSHSRVADATMRAVYDPGRDGDSFRSLSADDVAGICDIYPPTRKAATTSCENRHGFSGDCGADQPERDESKGCSLSTRQGVAGSTHGSIGSLFGALVLLCGARLARRKSIV